MNLQISYDLRAAKAAIGDTIAREIIPMNSQDAA
jgi:hypothetical protein